jgi:hypothetical protein
MNEKMFGVTAVRDGFADDRGTTLKDSRFQRFPRKHVAG